MLHFYKNSNDGVQGRGILSYANRTIEIGNYTEEAAKDYFGSGCGIKGILKFNEQVLDLNKDEIRKNWQQVHGGSDGHCVGSKHGSKEPILKENVTN